MHLVQNIIENLEKNQGNVTDSLSSTRELRVVLLKNLVVSYVRAKPRINPFKSSLSNLSLLPQYSIPVHPFFLFPGQIDYLLREPIKLNFTGTERQSRKAYSYVGFCWTLLYYRQS
jgi:hypothetical protein